MRLVLLSDIHANVTALRAVLDDVKRRGDYDAFALLGDLVNYGPRPNEVIGIVRQEVKPLVVNLWGNHEYSIFGGSLERFATDRGRSVLTYTNSILSEESRTYLEQALVNEGYHQSTMDGLRILFMHGNLDDPYWGKFGIDKMNDERYSEYDYVISGHSHVPHYVEHFFPSENKEYRNKKRTIFINPGSVGQPRNHNPYAQYGILDTKFGCYAHRCVAYDIEKEQELFSEKVDKFYKERIKLGV